MTMIEFYNPTIIAMAFAGFLLLLQLIVADLAAIKAGHMPGHPISAGSGSFLFRSARAHANTNESISVFLLLAVAGVLASASPVWINALSWAYVVSRFGHMAVYYANLKLPRSIFFGISLLALLAMFISVMAGLFGGRVV